MKNDPDLAPRIIFIKLVHCGQVYLATMNEDKTTWAMYHPDCVDAGPFQLVAGRKPVCPKCYEDIDSASELAIFSREGERLTLSTNLNQISHLN